MNILKNHLNLHMV